MAGVRAWTGHFHSAHMYVDDVSEVGRTTRWEGKLQQRDALIAELCLQPGPHNQVYFRSPLCVGFTRKHAEHILAQIFAHDGLVYVQSEALLYRHGDDFSDLLEAVAREAKAATQRRYRDRATSKTLEER